jgi:peroxiredoxin family protein
MKSETMVVTDPQQEEHEAQPKHLALNFSEGSLYQAYPPPAMATTAASMGREVGIFFTFYGLDIVLKERIPKLSVSPIGTPAMPPPIKNFPIHMPTMVEALPGMKSEATKLTKNCGIEGQPGSDTRVARHSQRIAYVRMFVRNTTLVVMNVAKEDLIEGVEFARCARPYWTSPAIPTFECYLGGQRVL